jgi:ethanolamine kinase
LETLTCHFALYSLPWHLLVLNHPLGLFLILFLGLFLLLCFVIGSRIAKKGWKYMEWSSLTGEKSPEPKFEALVNGATNKCYKVSYGEGRSGGKAEIGIGKYFGWIPKLGAKRASSDIGSCEEQLNLNGMMERGKVEEVNQVNGVSSVSSVSSSSFGEESLYESCERYAFMRVQGAGSVLSNPREQEMAIFQYAAKHGLGPRLYAVFENGYMAEYMKGRIVGVDEMREEEMMKRIAKVVASWHSLSIPSNVHAKRLIRWKGRKPLKTMSLHANTWQMIDKWLLRAKRLFNHEDAIALSNGLPSTFSSFIQELDVTKHDLLPFYALPHAIVLCHNDFNHGNLLFFPGAEGGIKRTKNGSTTCTSNDETLIANNDTSTLLAVDLEFAGINHRGFDLGNHFCEWAGLELNYHKCPSDDQMREWLSLYLDALGPSRGGYKLDEGEEIQGTNATNFSSSYTSFSPSTIQPISKAQMIEEMVVESRKWMQASHLFWWLWAMIQIKISNVQGFNAKHYAQTRWNEYMSHKEKTLAMKHPERLLQASPPFHKVYPSYQSSPTTTLTTTTTSSSSSSHTTSSTHRRRRSSTIQSSSLQ